MDWFLIWKVVLATAIVVVAINTATMAAKATRDAYHSWNASRSAGK